MVESYENLRAAVLRAELAPCSGLGTMRRQGLAAWMTMPRAPDIAPDHCIPGRRTPPRSSPAASELTSLIASIVINLIAEPTYA